MGGGDGTSYYANSVFLGGGTALTAVIAILVHLAVWGINPAMADLVALGAGVAGLLAGKQQSKGLLTCAMVAYIIVAIWYSLALLGYMTASSWCDGVDSTCQNPDGVMGYCCWKCGATTCEQLDGDGQKCMLRNEYKTCSCYGIDGIRSLDNSIAEVIDKQACEGYMDAYPNSEISWYCETTLARCEEGFGFFKNLPSGTGPCETEAQRGELYSGCGPSAGGLNDFSTYKQCTCNTAGCDCPAYTNKGCHGDEEGAEDINCDHLWGMTFLTFLTLAASIGASVMGCCVVCCGNDDVAGDDSG